MAGVEDIKVQVIDVKFDDRGRVFEVLRREMTKYTAFGQIYVFTAFPGNVKGNHYHLRKEEWFCCVVGEGEFVFANPGTGERRTVEVSAENPVAVRIPTGIAHAARNTGKSEMVVLAYITEPYVPSDPDTYGYQVVTPEP